MECGRGVFDPKVGRKTKTLMSWGCQIPGATEYIWHTNIGTTTNLRGRGTRRTIANPRHSQNGDFRMSTQPRTVPSIHSTHGLGVLCGLCAGVWLGAAEAPTKLVNSGLSPYAISLCMVAGVFVARWSLPTLLKGTRSVFADLAEHRHLIPVAILAGMLWAVANTLTVFAIRDV